MTMTLSHFSQISLKQSTDVNLVIPRANQIGESYGYVRSSLRALKVVEEGDVKKSPPFRDYDPDQVQVDVIEVIQQHVREHTICVGARNILNEFGYTARTNGKWIRRHDPSLDSNWPVLQFRDTGLTFCKQHEIDSESDVLTGLPLVIDGEAASREFIVANCSDVAHSFEVHPSGLVGPPPPAWLELGDAWEQTKIDQKTQVQAYSEIMAIADNHGCVESRDRLHSLICQSKDGAFHIIALTGSLTSIAIKLVEMDMDNGIILDNGGSTGFYYCRDKKSKPIQMLAGPNYRPKGIAFLVAHAVDFPQPLSHSVLD
ncbi:MAG: hypothetical protein GKR91_19895 [Pseudomonadales bacterium]|nr:hypothetical protein [Pseudomonadales bacterium]